MPDHAHILIGQNPSISISDFTKELKTATTHFIKNEALTKFKLPWQEGYGAFSYSKSQLDHVSKYILHQPDHHKKRSFRQEYLEFLEKYDVPFEEKYLFKWML